MSKTTNISVIIPTHNRCQMVQRAINSVLAQTYQDYEIIIVSDGSTDETEKVVVSYDDPRIFFLKHDKPEGASAARNSAIKASKGKYIAFLDDDDEWLPHKLALQLPVIENSLPEVGLVYGWMEYFEDGKLIDIRAPKIRGDVFVEMLDKQAIGGCPTIIIKREVVDRVGYFDEKLSRGNDGDYWRRISKHYHVDCVPEVLAKVHVGHMDRISVNSEKNLRNVIHALKKRLVDFETDFEKYPDQKSNVLFNIGAHYFEIREYSEAFNYFIKSVLGKRNLRERFIVVMRTGRLILSCLYRRLPYVPT